MFKKLLSFSVSIGMLLIVATPSFAAGDHTYEDLTDSPYIDAVDYLRRNGVFKDTKYFHPEITITKAEFIKYLVLLNDRHFKAYPIESLPFNDLYANSPYAPYFKEAIMLGILDDKEGEIYPYSKLPMTDALRLLFRSQEMPIRNFYEGSIPYKDVANNKLAAPVVMRALQLGVIPDKQSENLGIYKPITRAEAADMLYRMDSVYLASVNKRELLSDSVDDAELEKIIYTWNLIENSYLYDSQLDKSEITDEVLAFFIEQLDDPHSRYRTIENAQHFSAEQSGQIEGIGAVIGFTEENDDEITVVSPIDGSPADRAGLMAKDVILEVDGTSLVGMSLEDAVSLIKGPKGTTVELKIRRDGKEMSINVIRDVITIPTLDYEFIENDRIAYIKLHHFNQKITSEFRSVVEIIEGKPNVEGVILDVRGNPGGLLSAVGNILDYFVEPNKELVIIEHSNFSETLESRNPATLNHLSVVVLTNEGSASASEILAGTLQDYELARVVGEKSFGKGTVQRTDYLSDGSMITLTIAQWLTPNGRRIQDEGVYPDVEVVDNEETEADEQLDRAIEELKKLMNQ